MKPLPRSVGIAAAVISGVLIAAHFLRAGIYPLVVLGLVFPWLLLTGRRWATRTVQILLVLAAAKWVYTLLVIAAQRRADGQPWLRMALILGGVALFALLSAAIIRAKSPAEK